ncbi:MAG: TAXI family TRAP transporter solute-binding subunit [Verrucomicrobium sp.]|nr:TAXI family TRAP transporter solute-binding subunit [Verrucomicrobium sp.]
MNPPEAPSKLNAPLSRLEETFGISHQGAIGAACFIALVIVAAVFFFIHSAPPTHLTITAGPEGSIFYTTAQKYAAILKRQGVTLRVLSSHGSLENLQRLNDPSAKVDIGFVQDGVTSEEYPNLMSLGSVSYQPLLVFYRGTTAVDTLAALAGKRVVIGSQGSGTRQIALTLLEANGIRPDGATTLLDWDPQRSSQALLNGQVDAVFLMGEDASIAILRGLLTAPGVHLLSFSQQEAYARRFNWLSTLKMPEGAIDLAKDVPPRDVYLVGPTIELVARKKLHPALSDLILGAAQEIHGRPSLFQKKGEFPAPMEHGFRLSDDALRYYRSGKSFLYHHLPFWLASVVSRILVVIIPAIVVILPTLRLLPVAYRWRMRGRLLRWYRALLALEKDLFTHPEGDRAPLLKRLEEIEQAVNQLRLPASFADQFYSLRQHVDFVRAKITA